MRSHDVVRGAVVGFTLSLVVAGIAHAGAPTEQLKEHVDRVVQLLADPALKDKPTDRHAAVRKVADEIFDSPETARRALGTHWNERTPQERQEFTNLFAELLDRAYLSKIDLYQGEKVSYAGEAIDGNEATVKTRIVTKNGTEVPVDYRMHAKDGRWLVYDVNIEGVSLVANYRAQFNRIIQTESYQSLVRKLKAKETEPAASPSRRPRER